MRNEQFSICLTSHLYVKSKSSVRSHYKRIFNEKKNYLIFAYSTVYDGANNYKDNNYNNRTQY